MKVVVDGDDGVGYVGFGVAGAVSEQIVVSSVELARLGVELQGLGVPGSSRVTNCARRIWCCGWWCSGRVVS